MNEVKTLIITVRAVSPVRVGGSIDHIRGIDLPMATVGGKPVIPGASLKGAFRAELTASLLRLARENPLLRPCIATPTRSNEEKALQGFKEKACVVEEDPGDNTICPACYLLGAQGLVGFVRVPFLYASVSQEELVELPCDYARGTGRNVGPRTLEFVPKEATFTGELELVLRDEVRGWELGKPRPQFHRQDRWLEDGSWSAERIERDLVRNCLEAIDKLGGCKSRGYGSVAVGVSDPRSKS